MDTAQIWSQRSVIHINNYSVRRRLIGSRLIESAAYYNKKIAGPIIVITYILAQSDPIKRRALY